MRQSPGIQSRRYRLALGPSLSKVGVAYRPTVAKDGAARRERYPIADPEEVADLESSFSEVAVALFAPGTVVECLARIVDMAEQTVDGCDGAGVVAVDAKGMVSTVAASNPLAAALDKVQVGVDEGPGLDASNLGLTFYAADLADDDRWPTFGPSAMTLNVRSVLAYSLSADRLSALNLYGFLPAAFGATDRAQGQLFATLARVALDAAEDRAVEEHRAENLAQALRTRELIGQAQGILMERERITADQAFAVLRRASQRMNLKLREVAETLVETGESPSPPPRRPRPDGRG